MFNNDKPKSYSHIEIGKLYQYNGDGHTKLVLCLNLRISQKGIRVGDFFDFKTDKINNLNLCHLGRRLVELKNED